MHGLQESGKLVLYLRDINLPKADKYGTSQVMAFLQQLLTYQGFFDSKLEFVGKPANAQTRSCKQTLIRPLLSLTEVTSTSPAEPAGDSVDVPGTKWAEARAWQGLFASLNSIRNRVFWSAGLERIQIVSSMNPASTVGRQPLAPRFAALMHVAYMGYPSPAHLQRIISAVLTHTLDKVLLCCV